MRPLTETGADGVTRYVGWQSHASGVDVFVSKPAFANAYYAALRNMRAPSRIERAKDRVRRFFDAATEAGIAVDLGVRS